MVLFFVNDNEFSPPSLVGPVLCANACVCDCVCASAFVSCVFFFVVVAATIVAVAVMTVFLYRRLSKILSIGDR